MARQAREYARAPYSNFKVGAAVECAGGLTFTGCNIENSSYGSTLCAEHVALAKAVSEGAREFVRIAVIADADRPIPPCGACRQVILELCGREMEAVMAKLDGQFEFKKVSELLPVPVDQTLLGIQMSQFTTAILLMALLGASTQDSTWEEKAVNRVQQTLASRYDPTLPSLPFGNWLNKVVGPQSGVSWRLGECVEQNGTASEWEQGIPACVEATAILPDDRKFVAQIHVGSFKQGLSMTTKFHFAVIENESQFRRVGKLSDLPQLVRDPSSVKGPDEGKKLSVVTLPQIRLNGAAQYFYARSAALSVQPQTMPAGNTIEPPPPPTPPVAPRVSKGVITGEVVSRVQPIYPSIAKQINASGEVLVSVMINENGRVIDAKAIKGHPVLRAAAEEAARKWVFKPTLLDGKPVKQPGTLTFVFTPPR